MKKSHKKCQTSEKKKLQNREKKSHKKWQANEKKVTKSDKLV